MQAKRRIRIEEFEFKEILRRNIKTYREDTLRRTQKEVADDLGIPLKAYQNLEAGHFNLINLFKFLQKYHPDFSHLTTLK